VAVLIVSILYLFTLKEKVSLYISLFGSLFGKFDTIKNNEIEVVHSPTVPDHFADTTIHCAGR